MSLEGTCCRECGQRSTVSHAVYIIAVAARVTEAAAMAVGAAGASRSTLTQPTTRVGCIRRQRAASATACFYHSTPAPTTVSVVMTAKISVSVMVLRYTSCAQI